MYADILNSLRHPDAFHGAWSQQTSQLYMHPQMLKKIMNLPNPLKKLYQSIFYNINNLSLIDILPFKQKRRGSSPCHKLIKLTECFRCFDCSSDPRSLICSQCFQRGNHNNHRYISIRQQGDCDCGNPNIMKATSFCLLHLYNGEQVDVVIQKKEKVQFVLFMSQILIWIYQVQNLGQRYTSIKLLKQYVKYLIHINKQSLYYNKLTTQLLFEQNDLIIDKLVKIILKLSSHQEELIQLSLQLFMAMINYPTYRSFMLVKFIKYYNQLPAFQSNDYCRLFYTLMTYSSTVISALTLQPVALLPKRSSFSLYKYLSMLMSLKDIDKDAARALLKPIIKINYIPFQHLDKIQNRIQKSNRNIVEIFPSFLNEELFYYKTVIKIIQIIDDKAILSRMLVNYYLMICNYSFKRNKLILVPHRIFILIIYKYFDYDYHKISFKQLANIFLTFKINQKKVSDFIAKVTYKIIQCLHQYAQTLNQTTYFSNYLPLYVKQNAQIIQIDYIALKILALFDPSIYSRQIQSFYSSLVDCLGCQQKQTEVFKSKITLMKIIVEIVYSPRTQIIVLSFLGQEQKVSQYSMKTFARMFKNIDDLRGQQVELIKQFVCGVDVDKDKFYEILHYNKANKKFNLKQHIDQNELSIQHLKSLSLTKMKNLPKKKQQQGNIQLNEAQQHFKNILIPLQLFRTFVCDQFNFINNHPKYTSCIKQLITLMNNLKSFYHKQNSEYSLFFFKVQELFLGKGIQSEFNNLLPRQELEELIQFLHQSKGKQQNNRNLEQKQRQKEKKRQLLQLKQRAKKEQVMKNRKMRQNQQIYKSVKEEESQCQDVCLVCKQNKDIDSLCYLGKLRATDLMFKVCKLSGHNLMFKSCFHTIHYNCFKKINQSAYNSLFYCPLCKSACNILLPYSRNIPSGMTQNIVKAILKISAQNSNIILQLILSLVYFIVSNTNNSKYSSKKFQKLFPNIFNLIKHIFLSQQKQRQIFVISCLTLKQKFVGVQIHKKQNINKIKYISLFIVDILSSYLMTGQISKYLMDEFYSLKLQQSQQIINYLNIIVQTQSQYLQYPIQCKQQIGQNVSSLFNFYKPPNNITQLFQLKQKRHVCTLGHQILICMVCQYVGCFNCKSIKSHANECHPYQSLFFNLYTGGLYYIQGRNQISIKSQYINEQTGKSWNIMQKNRQYCLDEEGLKMILWHFQQSNLYSYLIHNFQGLKGKLYNDVI